MARRGMLTGATFVMLSAGLLHGQAPTPPEPTVTAPAPAPVPVQRNFNWIQGEVAPPAASNRKAFPYADLSGVFQADAGWFAQTAANRESVDDVLDGAAFRRARLTAVGAVAENVDYRFQMDFAFFARPTFTDVYFDVTDLPFGRARVGQWKQPVGLEETTSFRFNPFMERASIFLLKPFRRLGAGALGTSEDETFTWAASVFRSGQDQFGGDITDNGGAAGAARLTAAPIYDDDGARVLHLGGSYHLAGPSNDSLRFGAFGGNAPEFGLITGTFGNPSFAASTPSFVDTGVFAANLYQLLSAEVAAVLGPFSVQAEGVIARADRPSADAADFYGGYVFVSYFLFGGRRVYDRSIGAFGRLKLGRAFGRDDDGCCRGGDFELVARLSHLSLTDSGIIGGRITDATFGLNWYLNPYTKLSTNIIQVHMDRPPVGQSQATVFAIRAQVEF